MKLPFRPKTNGSFVHQAVLFLVALLLGCTSCLPARPPLPREVSLWYWHSPFETTEAQAQILDEMNVQRLYVRAGTISNDGSKLVLVMPQEFEDDATGRPTTLVFPFDSGAVGHFEIFDLDVMAQGVATRILARVDSAEKAGITVDGVQLDMDCPTRLLPRYGQFVRRMRDLEPRLKKTTFSTTALFSWLGTTEIHALAKELDYIVPQAYEGFTGKTIDKARPVSDPSLLTRLKFAEELDCPYMVGLPAYGRGTRYAPDGSLHELFRELSPGRAMRTSLLKFQDAYPADSKGRPADEENSWSGEQFLRFRDPEGGTVHFSIPSAEQFRKSLTEAKRLAGPRCKGFVIFRWPEEEETLTLSLRAMNDVLHGREAKPRIEAEFDGVDDAYGSLETGAKDAPRVFFAKFTNTGSGGTMIAPDALTITVLFPQGALRNVGGRDALRFQTGKVLTDGTWQPTERERASAVRFWLAGLASGESAAVGPVTVAASGANQVKLHWTARSPDGQNLPSPPIIKDP